jgi:hypothetical protein
MQQVVMMKRILSMLVVAALACGTSLASASAQDVAAGGAEVAAANPDVPAPTEEGPPSGTDLKAEMLKLMSNARAGSVSPSSPPRRQPVKSNGFGKGRKVAVGVGAAAAVIILVIVLSRGDDSDRFKAPPCPAGQLCL